jgi:hypothetical protein
MQEALMRRGLRFLAVAIPILLSLAVSVLAAPSRMTANIDTTSRTHDLAPIQSDFVRLFIR